MKLNPNDACFTTPGTGNPLASTMIAEHDVEGSVCFRFTKYEVAAGDISRFLALFAPDRLSPTGLRSCRGNLNIQLPTPAARDGEPFLCEATRHFCRTFHVAFPGWAFFFTLESLALWKMSLALLDEAQVFQFQRAWQTRIVVAPQVVEALVHTHLMHAEVLATFAELPNFEAIRLTIAVREYFDKMVSAYRMQ